MADELLARMRIREIVENWVLWRDTGAWDRLRTCYHPDGRMQTVWFQGSVDAFIAGCRLAVRPAALAGAKPRSLRGLR